MPKCPDCGANAWLVKGVTARCRLCDHLWRIEVLLHEEEECASCVARVKHLHKRR